MATNQKLIERDRAKLAANLREAKRQMEFIGVRMGVLRELRRLERQRARIAARLIERDPESKDEYMAQVI